jgi:hypothetical protein
MIVTDRLNDRIQAFNADRKFIEQWNNLGIKQPSGLYIEPGDVIYTNNNLNDEFVTLKGGKVLEKFNVGGRPHLFGVDRSGAIYEADAINGVVKKITKK